jgi:methyl-accepting chemotaxis protein
MARMPRLTRKLVLMFLAFGVLPMAIVTAITLSATKMLEETEGQELQSAAQAVADKIDRNLYERYGDAQAFGFNEVWLDRADWYQADESKNRLIRAFNRYMTSYSGIYLFSVFVDTTGRVVALNTRDEAGNPIDSLPLFAKSYADEPWFKAIMAGKFTTKQPNTAPGNDVSTGTFVEDWHVDDDVARLYPKLEGGLVAFAAPVKDHDGKIVGGIVNHARFNLVEEIVASTYAELERSGMPAAEITVVDGGGRILMDYDPLAHGTKAVKREAELIGKLSLSERGDASVRRALRGEGGSEIIKHYETGREYLAGFAPLRGAMGFPGMNWAVQVRLPKEIAFAALGAIRWELGLAAAVCLALILAGGFWLGKRMAAPMIEMTHAAAAISRGDVDQHITHHGQDEVGDLADALRGTVDYIKGATGAATSIGRGDLSLELAARSSEDVLAQSLIAARDSLRKLNAESRRLIAAAQAGDLRVRGSNEGLAGGYREIVDGMNQVLAAVAAPIGEAKDALRRVSEKDLSARMTGAYAGDYDAVKQGLNQALDILSESLAQVSSAADQVATAASEITQGNQQTAQATSEQAGSLEEITSSLQEITAMSKRSAANAQQARGLAEGARETAEQGASSVKRMSEAIDKIKHSADETAKIVKTIDEIAFQTNLLALNAAVEAARAGDAGKGFAVVAEEVRALAMRSAEAAKNVAELISASVKNAEEGVALNHDVTKGFDAIAGKVRGVVEVMSEIAAASEQQSDGVSQVNGNIEDMSKMTQQNAATTEETASAAEELSGQATELRSLVAEFRLTGASARTKPSVRLPRPATVATPNDDGQAF